MSITSTASPSRKLDSAGIAAAEPEIVWQASGIGEVLNLTPKQVFHLLPTLEKAGVVRKINGRWAATRAKLISYVAGE